MSRPSLHLVGFVMGHPDPTALDDGLMSEKSDKQLLHLVFGGELDDLDATTFVDLNTVDLVGLFPNYASAYAAWKTKAQGTVDNANTRYFIAHLHRLLDPS